MATREFQDKRQQLSELLGEVIELAGKPENQSELGALRHMILGDYGSLLASKLEQAKIKSNGVPCMATNPEIAYMSRCAAMQPKTPEIGG